MKTTSLPPKNGRGKPVLVSFVICLPILYGLRQRLDEVQRQNLSQNSIEMRRMAERREAKIEEQIFQAAAKGDSKTVKSLLLTSDGLAALRDPRNYWYEQVAFRRRGEIIMETFWQCGIFPKPGELTETLTRTVRDNREAAALWLIGKGAVVRKSPHGGNLLQGACYFGKEKLVSALLAAGADPNRLSTRRAATSLPLRPQNSPILPETGWTVLMTATEQKHPVAMKILLAHGANMNTKTSRGTTALVLARQNHWQEGERLLLAAGAIE